MSVIVTNFDYAPYLGEAIDSALAQDHERVEVVVVDDGSTDGSRDVIERYRGRVTPVCKENGGQGSAVNAGFRAASGDVVIFLDADDVLLPGAAGEAAALLAEPGVVKGHWPLRVIDEHGRATGALFPGGALSDGDLRDLLLSSPDHGTPPQSGNAFSRAFLEHVLPMPEPEFRTGADTYLFLLVLPYGEVRAADTPRALYRRHGGNQYSGQSFDDRLSRLLAWTESSYAHLAVHCERRGVPADPPAWRQNSWVHRLAAARAELGRLVPSETRFALIDDDDWGMRPDGSLLPVPFLERDGEYWGPPPDAETAIAELERLRREGVGYLIVGWPAFWWLDHFPALREYLAARFPCLADNDRLIAYDLTPS